VFDVIQSIQYVVSLEMKIYHETHAECEYGLM